MRRRAWPKITAALTAKHPWLVIACDGCGMVVDLDLRATLRLRSGLRFAMCAALGAMGMADHGSLH
jgi:hypothetical protein